MGDVETMELAFPPGYFDCILYADVLEQLRDPWALLRRLRLLLSPIGVLVASIPNLRHACVLAKIIFDRFEYEPSGILDRTTCGIYMTYDRAVIYIDRLFRRIRRCQSKSKLEIHPPRGGNDGSGAPVFDCAVHRGGTTAAFIRLFEQAWYQKRKEPVQV